MQKKIIIAVTVVALLAGAIYIVTGTRLFKDSPNIVIILADDMDRSLLPFVEKTNELIGAQGATFENFFITTPLCCPSRASILRGQYAHNTDILDNAPGFVRFFKLNHEIDALPVWLNSAGYATSYLGKYLNNYPINAGRNYVPPGWTDWHAFLYEKDTEDFYYDYTMNENGEIVEYGNAPEEYSTDVIRGKAVDFITRSSAANKPFFLFVSAYGPHGPFISAPRHESSFPDLTYPQTPSFNEADVSDKPLVIQSLTQTGDDFDEDDANVFFQARARAIQSVDEMVEEIVRTLEQTGELENTYIFFLSDNGYRMGEHRIPSGKGTAYEEDIRVPLMVRGPGIEPGTQVEKLTANIDLAPTIADIINVSPPEWVDGRSFLPFLLGDETNWRNGLLVEFESAVQESSNNVQTVSLFETPLRSIPLVDMEADTLLVDVDGGNFNGIRGEMFVYIEYSSGESEFYDLTADPYQLENIANTLSQETLDLLHVRLEELRACTGTECRVLEEELNIEFK